LWFRQRVAASKHRIRPPFRNSGDTVPLLAVPAHCHRRDILIHEGGFYHSERATTYRRQFHTPTEELLDIARVARPKLLVLYHQPRGNDEAGRKFIQAGFDGGVAVAKDLDAFR
jgi:ribonuclease BN (tRNA processing enzyme)